MGKMAKAVIIVVICVLLLSWFFVYFFFFTSSGAAFLVRKAVATYFPSTTLQIKAEGNLVAGVVLENVEFTDIQGFPLPNSLKIQDFQMKADGFDVNKITVHVQNARLSLPYSDPVVFSLDIADGEITGNIHTRVLVSDDLSWLPIKIPSGLEAEVRRVDIDFEGDAQQLTFFGSFDISRVKREDVVFQDSSCQFSLTVKEVGVRTVGLYGEAIFTDGTLSGRRTAVIVLNEGKLIFEGDPLNPRFDIRASSQVEKVRMDITVRGYFNHPDLYLRSGSGLSQDRLLMMLATNQSWGQVEQGIVDQNLSPGAAKDFLDYFLSGYSGGGGFSWFLDWVRRVSVDYDQETGQIGLRAGLTDRFEAGYMPKQTRTAETGGIYKLTGEYQFSDRFSLQGEKELRDRVSESGEPFHYSTTPDDRVLFKIRQKF